MLCHVHENYQISYVLSQRIYLAPSGLFRFNYSSMKPKPIKIRDCFFYHVFEVEYNFVAVFVQHFR